MPAAGLFFKEAITSAKATKPTLSINAFKSADIVSK
jgi:hypothetical protein